MAAQTQTQARCAHIMHNWNTMKYCSNLSENSAPMQCNTQTFAPFQGAHGGAPGAGLHSLHQTMTLNGLLKILFDVVPWGGFSAMLQSNIGLAPVTPVVRLPEQEWHDPQQAIMSQFTVAKRPP